LASNDLARLLLGPGPSGYGVSLVMGAICTAWNPTTYENAVSDGANRWTNLPVLAPTLMTTGRVALLSTAGRPIILGPLYVYTP
jgi:ABC-type polysaccharide transport system permease subunit